MTKKKSTKRALLMSALSLLMCVSMFVGSTFAWFTDTVTSGSNVIQSGNLDVEVQYTLDGEHWNDLNGATDLFKKGLWEPGHTEVVALKISNKGTLALKYAANMNIFDENIGKTADGKDIVLSDILTVSTLVVGVTDEVDPFLGINISEETLKRAFSDENGLAYPNSVSFKKANVLKANQQLFAGDAHYAIIKVDMAETVGNEANHNGVNVPTINFGIDILATQYTYEHDSFGNDYDEYAAVSTVAEMKEALANGITEFNFMGSTINLNYGLKTDMVPKGTTITIANANVSGKSYGNGVDGTVIFESCNFTNTGAYSIHFDNGAGDVVFKNCTLYGWNSFGSTLNSVSFYDSALYGNGTYALIRSYVNLYLENCVIDTTNANHTDQYSDGVEAVNGAELTMVNCTKAIASAEDFLEATEGGNIALNGDITYNNTDPDKQMILEADSAINFDGNGSTITVTGADPSVGNHGYVGFVPPAGEDVTVNDLTVTGTGFVEMGDWNCGGGEYVANNLVLKNMVSTLDNGDAGNRLACTFCHYGTATLNNCEMTGATALIDGTIPVDAGFVHDTTTTINNGKYGHIYVWGKAIVSIYGAEIDTITSRANTYQKGSLVIGAGTHIDTLKLICSSTQTPALTIEEGATINSIVYDGKTYTQAEWLAR